MARRTIGLLELWWIFNALLSRYLQVKIVNWKPSMPSLRKIRFRNWRRKRWSGVANL